MSVDTDIRSTLYTATPRAQPHTHADAAACRPSPQWASLPCSLPFVPQGSSIKCSPHSQSHLHQADSLDGRVRSGSGPRCCVLTLTMTILNEPCGLPEHKAVHITPAQPLNAALEWTGLPGHRAPGPLLVLVAILGSLVIPPGGCNPGEPLSREDGLACLNELRDVQGVCALNVTDRLPPPDQVVDGTHCV